MTPMNGEATNQEEVAGVLRSGPLHWFRDWPIPNVPTSGSIVYTVWDREGAFIYVGMAGRSEATSARGKGPRGRLESHASDRRSGNQFCIYVCDRFVLPGVDNRIPEIAAGTLFLDALPRGFIHEQLAFRFVFLPDPMEALEVERRLQRGDWPAGAPVLNPGIRPYRD